MQLAPMTESWTKTLRAHLETLKAAGLDPISALRAAEILCGKANEEFESGGRQLVEEVYGGTFSGARGGAGMLFRENPKAESKPVTIQSTASTTGKVYVGTPVATVEANLETVGEWKKPPRKPAKPVDVTPDGED